MSGAPVVLTDEVLGTREQRTLIFVSPEEQLPLRIKAYVQNENEISFMVKQPSASAILVNKPYIDLQVEFTIEKQGAALDENDAKINMGANGSQHGKLVKEKNKKYIILYIYYIYHIYII